MPNTPTEMIRSWIGKVVPVLVYSAGASTTPAIGAPEPRQGHRGRILRYDEGFQQTARRHKQLQGHHQLREGFHRLLPLARRFEDCIGCLGTGGPG
ncbi:MAG TPA: hypothetical protein VHF46_05610 [Rubrobacteraceae bacterium]|nr:hypothetical protein [Rubrobacteraceae bacterium]